MIILIIVDGDFCTHFLKSLFPCISTVPPHTSKHHQRFTSSKDLKIHNIAIVQFSKFLGNYIILDGRRTYNDKIILRSLLIVFIDVRRPRFHYATCFFKRGLDFICLGFRYTLTNLRRKLVDHGLTCNFGESSTLPHRLYHFCLSPLLITFQDDIITEIRFLFNNGRYRSTNLNISNFHLGSSSFKFLFHVFSLFRTHISLDNAWGGFNKPSRIL